jgi:hypothetical protein
MAIICIYAGIEMHNFSSMIDSNKDEITNFFSQMTILVNSTVNMFDDVEFCFGRFCRGDWN